MHNAPSVTYPVGRSFWAAGGLAAVWTSCLLVTALWSWQLPGAGWRMVLAWIACAATGAWAAHSWWNGPTGVLHGSGNGWWWEPAEGAAGPGELQVALDLQHVLLLRLSLQGAVAWLWLERRSRPGQWESMRRAVYSRANPDGLPDAEPPSATP